MGVKIGMKVEHRLVTRVKIGMKVEQKLFDFSAEKQIHNENMETKAEICGTEIETNFFGGSGSENGTTFFS
jgi:hypothetical protein